MPLCVREGIAILPYFPLASGFLTGKYRTSSDKTKSVRGGGAVKHLDGKGKPVLAALDAVAARHHATCAQVALAWVMAKPAIAAPIASVTSVAQITELMGALELTLTMPDIAAPRRGQQMKRLVAAAALCRAVARSSPASAEQRNPYEIGRGGHSHRQHVIRESLRALPRARCERPLLAPISRSAGRAVPATKALSTSSATACRAAACRRTLHPITRSGPSSRTCAASASCRRS